MKESQKFPKMIDVQENYLNNQTEELEKQVKRTKLHQKAIINWLRHKSKRNQQKIKPQYLFYPEEILYDINLKKIFSVFDEDNSNALDLNEMVEMFNKYNFKVTEQQIEKMYKLVNNGKKSALNFDKFKEWTLSEEANKIFSEIIKGITQIDDKQKQINKQQNIYNPRNIPDMLKLLSFLISREQKIEYINNFQNINDRVMKNINKFIEILKMQDLNSQHLQSTNNNRVKQLKIDQAVQKIRHQSETVFENQNINKQISSSPNNKFQLKKSTNESQNLTFEKIQENIQKDLEKFKSNNNNNLDDFSDIELNKEENQKQNFRKEIQKIKKSAQRKAIIDAQKIFNQSSQTLSISQIEQRQVLESFKSRFKKFQNQIPKLSNQQEEEEEQQQKYLFEKTYDQDDKQNLEKQKLSQHYYIAKKRNRFYDKYLKTMISNINCSELKKDILSSIESKDKRQEEFKQQISSIQDSKQASGYNNFFQNQQTDNNNEINLRQKKLLKVKLKSLDLIKQNNSNKSQILQNENGLMHVKYQYLDKKCKQKYLWRVQSEKNLTFNNPLFQNSKIEESKILFPNTDGNNYNDNKEQDQKNKLIFKGKTINYQDYLNSCQFRNKNNQFKKFIGLKHKENFQKTNSMRNFNFYQLNYINLTKK